MKMNINICLSNPCIPCLLKLTKLTELTELIKPTKLIKLTSLTETISSGFERLGRFSQSYLQLFLVLYYN